MRGLMWRRAVAFVWGLWVVVAVVILLRFLGDAIRGLACR